jgi:hypothetical protein
MVVVGSMAEAGSTVVAAANIRSLRRDPFLCLCRNLRKPVTFSTLPGAESRFSRIDVSANHSNKLTRGFQRLFGVTARNKSSVVIECHVPLTPEPVEDGHQAGIFSCQFASGRIRRWQCDGRVGSWPGTRG